MNWFEIKGHWLHIDDERILLSDVCRYSPSQLGVSYTRARGESDYMYSGQAEDTQELIDALDEYFKNEGKSRQPE
jgi:hypothetical protein